MKNRKGFIKYALQFGYSVYPAYCFNETCTYYTYNAYENARLKINSLKIPATLFWGPFVLFPRRSAELLMVVGNKIIFPQISNPSKEDVDKYHQLYIEKLVILFEKYKNYLSFPCNLEIV